MEEDPVFKAERQELDKIVVENSMRGAFSCIEDNIGWENWVSDTHIRSLQKKRAILTNMLEWFALPDIEEYEKCVKIKTSLDKVIAQLNLTNHDEHSINYNRNSYRNLGIDYLE